MNLKEAREIARKVGATIEENRKGLDLRPGAINMISAKDALETGGYWVRLGVVRIGENGTREDIKIHAVTPDQAADLAVIETGRACRALMEHAKRVYVDSDLIFGAQRS